MPGLRQALLQIVLRGSELREQYQLVGEFVQQLEQTIAFGTFLLAAGLLGQVE